MEYIVYVFCGAWIALVLMVLYSLCKVSSWASRKEEERKLTTEEEEKNLATETQPSTGRCTYSVQNQQSIENAEKRRL